MGSVTVCHPVAHFNSASFAGGTGTGGERAMARTRETQQQTFSHRMDRATRAA